LNRICLPGATSNLSNRIRRLKQRFVLDSLYFASCETTKKGLKVRAIHGQAVIWFQEVSMLESRRRLMMTCLGAAGVLASQPLIAALQAPGPGTRPAPQPRPSPNTPNPNFPPGLKGPKVTGPDKKAIDRQNQEEIRTDVTRLYEMVSELKDQVDQTDTNSTLAVSVVKKAQQIEKLAKQIKDLAKG
jgi:hypothetical protein